MPASSLLPTFQHPTTLTEGARYLFRAEFSANDINFTVFVGPVVVDRLPGEVASTHRESGLASLRALASLLLGPGLKYAKNALMGFEIKVNFKL